MEPTPDELAGIVDLFGGLSRADLGSAVENVAARQGAAFDPEAVDSAVDRALREYYLVAVETDDERLLAAGPTALPTLPDHGEDLPHMMDVEPVEIPPARLGEAVATRLEADVEAALSDAEPDRLETLLDVCYAAEAWTAVEVTAQRDRLQAALDAG